MSEHLMDDGENGDSDDGSERRYGSVDGESGDDREGGIDDEDSNPDDMGFSDAILGVST